MSQASEADVPKGINGLGRCRQAEHHSSEDVEPSRDKHIRLLEEDIALFNFSLHQLHVYREPFVRRHLA